MKIFSSLLLCLSLLPSAFAQEVTVSSTEEFTNNRPEANWYKMLGQDATGYYVLRKSGSISNEHLWLEHYSPSLRFISSHDIDGTSGVMGESFLHRATEFNNGKVLIFLEGWSKTDMRNSLVVKEVNADGTLSQGRVLETEPSASQMKSADYSISFSPDGTKLLVMTEKPFVKGGREELRLQVFSTTDYSSIWSQDMTLENEAVRSPDNSVKVNNEGVAYLFKDIKISNKEHIYQLMTSGKEFTKLSAVDLNGYFPTDYRMLIDPAGKVVVGGTLATAGENASNWRATWLLRGSATGAITDNKVEQLGPQVLRLVASEKASQVANASLDNYVLRDVLLKPDGGVLLLTEYERKSSTNVSVAPAPPVYQTGYEFGNVLMISFDESGNRLWSQVLEKRQSEVTMEPTKHYGSFTYQLKGDELCLVWNFMDLHVDSPLRTWRYWFDRSGEKINIDNIFGKEALYPSLLTVINADGTFRYAERSFNSLPLEEIQKSNAFPMAIDPSYYFMTPKGIVVLSRIPGQDSRRFKFNTINY